MKLFNGDLNLTQSYNMKRGKPICIEHLWLYTKCFKISSSHLTFVSSPRRGSFTFYKWETEREWLRDLAKIMHLVKWQSWDSKRNLWTTSHSPHKRKRDHTHAGHGRSLWWCTITKNTAVMNCSLTISLVRKSCNSTGRCKNKFIWYLWPWENYLI